MFKKSFFFFFFLGGHFDDFRLNDFILSLHRRFDPIKIRERRFHPLTSMHACAKKKKKKKKIS